MLFFLMTNKITKYTLKANKKLFKKLDRSFFPQGYDTRGMGDE